MYKDKKVYLVLTNKIHHQRHQDWRKYTLDMYREQGISLHHKYPGFLDKLDLEDGKIHDAPYFFNMNIFCFLFAHLLGVLKRTLNICFKLLLNNWLITKSPFEAMILFPSVIDIRKLN